MKSYEVNPFQVLYVTDSPDPKEFVRLFSDIPVLNAQALFRPGNVVLKGTQGSGKSMLLNLFKPQIKLAYAKAGEKFPVPSGAAQFIGAGINLTRSGVLDIGQRPLSQNREQDEEIFPLYFADFINYFIVRDILRTIEVIIENSEVFQGMVHKKSLDDFAKLLGGQDCWFGALDECSTFSQLRSSLDDRIFSYRAFHQYNGELLPEIEHTKTAIGEPIARTEECLKLSGVISDNVPIYVRIDQIERLCRSDVLRPFLGRQYRRVINKALGARDYRISYRIGTRRYAWNDDLIIYGTEDKLEHIRDFRVIDIDETLRRKEDTKTWIFPDFAADAFLRRLKNAKYENVDKADVLKKVFGSASPPSVVAQEYAKNSTSTRFLKIKNFPEDWSIYLTKLYKNNPLEAYLATAWARQSGGPENPPGHRLAEPPPTDLKPWNRTYWRKERIRQALLQIAARSAQRFKWSGKEQIVSLSAGNISIFITICHEIWDAFLRSERRKEIEKRRDPVLNGISPDIQAVGFFLASTHWYNKIAEQPKGDDRRRFVDVLGRTFRKWLLDDSLMSYPGRNGFSLSIGELEKHSSIKNFLEEAVDYEDLYEAPHTTKQKNRKQRRKWYLGPILSPFFQLPESHIKEPYYASINDVVDWLREAEIFLEGIDKITKSKKKKGTKKKDGGTLPLFE